MENVAEKKSSKPQAVGKKSSKGKSLMKIIQERQTSELVIAFCGPVGSGISHVVEELADCLNQAGYTHVDPLKVSDYIIKYSPSINSKEEIDAMPLGEKIEKLQDAGNELRSKYGNDILSQIIVKEIAINRQLILNPDADKAEGEIEISVEPRKHATIIDSLKHPEEVDLLKAIYGNTKYYSRLRVAVGHILLMWSFLPPDHPMMSENNNIIHQLMWEDEFQEQQPLEDGRDFYVRENNDLALKLKKYAYKVLS